MIDKYISIDKGKEVMKIICFDSGMVELYMNGKKRKVCAIKFEVGENTPPVLTTKEHPFWEQEE